MDDSRSSHVEFHLSNTYLMYTEIWSMVAIKCSDIVANSKFVRRFLYSLPRDLSNYLSMARIRETEVEEVVLDVPVTAEMAMELKREIAVVLSGELSKEPAKVEPISVKLIKDAGLPPSCRVQRVSKVITKFSSDSLEQLLRDGFIVSSLLAW